MKLLLLVLVFLTCSFPARAEQALKVKGGYADILCLGISDSPSLALEYEVRSKHFGVGVEVNGLIPDIEDVGYMGILTGSIIPKVYYKNVYLGIKAGYLITFEKSDMDGDDEFMIGGVLGMEFEDYFIETQMMIADLDLETNYFDKTAVIEDQSRLNNWQVLVGKKIRF